MDDDADHRSLALECAFDDEHRVTASYCLDNAMAESFFATLTGPTSPTPSITRVE